MGRDKEGKYVVHLPDEYDGIRSHLEELGPYRRLRRQYVLYNSLFLHN